MSSRRGKYNLIKYSSAAAYSLNICADYAAASGRSTPPSRPSLACGAPCDRDSCIGVGVERNRCDCSRRAGAGADLALSPEAHVVCNDVEACRSSHAGWRRPRRRPSRDVGSSDGGGIGRGSDEIGGRPDHRRRARKRFNRGPRAEGRVRGGPGHVPICLDCLAV